MQQTTLGERFRIVKRLAVGGMAEIFLATAYGLEGFEKPVVIKRILPQCADVPEFVGMFLDEARLVAKLHHPNIAQVYDVGFDGRCHYFVMEYVNGRDVCDILNAAGEPIPFDYAVAIGMGVASGLHAAHEQRGCDGVPLQIVHRDVSPDNVIVNRDGAVKLIDFGIAKAARRQTQTQVGVIKGKSRNMSPEQCTSGKVDRRSDIFALGILLWELTVGEPLFCGNNEFEIMRRIATADAPRPSERRRRYPKKLEAIVMRALARDPNARYQTARDLLLDLDAFAREHRLAVAPHSLGDFVAELFPRSRSERSLDSRPPLFLTAPSTVTPLPHPPLGSNPPAAVNALVPMRRKAPLMAIGILTAAAVAGAAVTVAALVM